MYDAQQYKNLQNRSHVRGLLSKQFYSAEQADLDRKRKQMKQILDQQVEERRRQKEKVKNEEHRKLRREDDDIQRYYANISERHNVERDKQDRKDREKKEQYGYSQGQGYSPPHQGQQQRNRGSPQTVNVQHERSRARLKTNPMIDEDGDIPVMPVMEFPNHRQPQNYTQSYNQSNHHHHHQQNYSHPNSLQNLRNSNGSGNVPLLDLGEENSRHGQVNAHQHQQSLNQPSMSKRNKDRTITISSNNFSASSPPKQSIPNHSKKFNFQQNHMNVLEPDASEESYPGSRRNTESKETYPTFHPNLSASRQQNLAPPPQLEQENKQLKNELKKSQEAISLLIGAVRSNVRFDKYRVQAEKILHGNSPADPRESRLNSGDDRNQSGQKTLLPKLTLRHQSIMHDYMFGAARKAYKTKQEKNGHKDGLGKAKFNTAKQI